MSAEAKKKPGRPSNINPESLAKTAEVIARINKSGLKKGHFAKIAGIASGFKRYENGEIVFNEKQFTAIYGEFDKLAANAEPEIVPSAAAIEVIEVEAIADDELTDEEVEAQELERVKVALSICESDVTSTALKPWVFDNSSSLASEFKRVKVGKKNGSYFVRYGNGIVRNDKSAPDEADVLILDGDSRITADGEIAAGGPNPYLVHDSLQKHGFSHVIYSSYSNGEQGDDYFKYRVLIFVKYTRQQLHTLLNYFHELLHNDGVMLLNVKENRAWSQPWFLPRIPAEREHLFTFYEFLDGYKPYTAMTESICTSYEAAHPRPPEPVYTPKPKVIKEVHGAEISVIDLFNNHWKSPVYYLNSEEGYRYRGNRLLPPHCSEDSIAGVQICQQCIDGVERVYSHHSNDPLSKYGKAHDSFDCYKILRHGGDEKAAIKAIAQSWMINGETIDAYNKRQFNKPRVHINFDSLAEL